jgi:hypothetical protein
LRRGNEGAWQSSLRLVGGCTKEGKHAGAGDNCWSIDARCGCLLEEEEEEADGWGNRKSRSSGMHRGDYSGGERLRVWCAAHGSRVAEQRKGQLREGARAGVGERWH